MKKGVILFVFLINLTTSFQGISASVLSDTLKVNDTTRTEITKKEKRWKVMFSLDARRSFIIGQNVKLGGFKLGLQYDSLHRFGIGLHTLNKDLIRSDITVNESDATDTSNVSFGFGYFSLYYERVIYQKRKWEFSVPVHLGVGSIQTRYQDTAGVYQPWFERPVSPLEVSFKGQYRIIRWLAFGPGIGYRVMLTNDRAVTKAFNGPIYTLQLKLLLGEVYRMIFKKNDG